MLYKTYQGLMDFLGKQNWNELTLNNDEGKHSRYRIFRAIEIKYQTCDFLECQSLCCLDVFF